MTMPQHIPVAELAAKLSVSEDTVRRMIASGRIPAMKVGRQYRIDPHEVTLALSNTGNRKD